MHKNLLSLFVLLSLSLTSFAAETITLDEIKYTISTNADTAIVSGYTTMPTGDLVIPNTVMYEDKEYTVTAVGKSAFASCTGLTSVVFGDNITSIGETAFRACSGITSITFPDNLTSIGSEAFYYCKKITNLVLPNTVTTIDSDAFHYCTGLLSITFPDKLTTIASYTFKYCTSLTTITFPETLSTIGTYAFQYCSGLTSVTLPESVSSIGDYAFQHCSKLVSFEVAADNAYYTAVDGVLFDKEQTTLISFPISNSLTEYTIPASVTTLSGYSFYSCESLTDIILPETLSTIGASAFGYCTGLTVLELPDSVSSVASTSFNRCSKLENFEVSANNPYFTEVDGVLYDKEKTTLHCFPEGKPQSTYTVLDGVTTLLGGAFSYCSGLTSITLPASIETAIPILTFIYCTNLTELYFLKEEPVTVSSYAFTGVTLSDVTLYVPTDSKSAYEEASVWCNFGSIVEIEVLGIEAVSPSATQVVAQNGAIVVTGVSRGAAIVVYNLQGGVVASAVASDSDTQISGLTHGIYVVRAGDSVTKVSL